MNFDEIAPKNQVMAPSPVSNLEPATFTLQTTDGNVQTIMLSPNQFGLQMHNTPLLQTIENVPVQDINSIPPRTVEVIQQSVATEDVFDLLQPVRLPKVEICGGTFQLITVNQATTLNNLNVSIGDSKLQDDLISSKLNTIDDLKLELKSNFIDTINCKEIKSKNSTQIISNNEDVKNTRKSTSKNQSTAVKKSKMMKLAPKVKNVEKKVLCDSKRNFKLNNSLTPIPLKPTPPQKMLIQPETSDTPEWNKGASHQTVYVLQSGDQYHSVEKLDGEKLRVVTDAVNSVVASPENKNNVLFDPATKTRIIYKVLNPEDLNLCAPNENIDGSAQQSATKKSFPKKNKSKTTSQTDSQNQKIMSVTRSGRCVRPPRHISLNYEQKNSADIEVVEAELYKEALIKNLDIPADKVPLRYRLTCPFCRKAYHSSKRMARHFHMFPGHAIDSKCLDLLSKYKIENKPKSNLTSDAETQTDFVTLPNFSNGINSMHSKKDAETDANFSRYHRDDKSLFRGFMRILRSTMSECRASVFIRQLALFTVKLRKLLPCLLHRTNNSSLCLINEPVSKILDIAPGKYHLDLDAIACSKIPSGMCIHSQNPQPIIDRESSNTFTDPWLNDSNKNCAEKVTNVNKCSRTNPIDKWSSNVPKRKWIPIGSANDINEPNNSNQENWISTSDLLPNSSFTSNDKPIDNWKTNVHERNHNNKIAKNESWISNGINELSKINMSHELESQNHLLNNNQDNDLDGTLDTNLVFDMEKEILPIDIKNSLTCSNQSSCMETSTEETSNFDFNDGHFDMQIDKLNFTNAQYNEMKYASDSLPQFGRIDASKSIQMPIKSLNNINSESVKSHLPSNDPILANDPLELAINATHQIDVLNPMVNPGKTVNMCSKNNAIHRNNQALLESVELNLPIDESSSINVGESILNVNESSLDESNLSSTQSVLNLLDPLGSDCLSFSDNDLNSRSSQMALDLQLDLFPFHHS